MNFSFQIFDAAGVDKLRLGVAYDRLLSDLLRTVQGFEPYPEETFFGLH